MPQTEHPYGLVHLGEFGIQCDREVLGRSFPIEVGGHRGKLELPSLPVDWPTATDPLHQPLLAPPQASDWRKGSEALFWGRPDVSPAGHSSVDLILMTFDRPNGSIETAVNEISADSGRWHKDFEDYISILTGQRCGASALDRRRFDIFYWSRDKRAHPDPIPSEAPTHITERRLNIEDLERICTWCSERKPPRLEWRLLLDARRAFCSGDFRKTIIEASVAIEVTLTLAIERELDSNGTTFADGLLENFRTLSGRVKLAKLIGLSAHFDEIEKFLVNSRNRVAHRGSYPDRASSKKALDLAEKVTHLLSSGYPEN